MLTPAREGPLAWEMSCPGLSDLLKPEDPVCPPRSSSKPANGPLPQPDGSSLLWPFLFLGKNFFYKTWSLWHIVSGNTKCMFPEERNQRLLGFLKCDGMRDV